ncbi:MAG: dihydropteroate synthase [Halocynthiibacter sp.]
MQDYYRPIVGCDTQRPDGALPVAGGWAWFAHAEKITRGGARTLVDLDNIPEDVLRAISAPRAPMAGLDFTQPRLMGVLNVTPDSFSDGGKFNAPVAALARARDLAAGGADIIDIGGESTRPGAEFVPAVEECARTVPVIEAIRRGSDVPVSIDTRKAIVGCAALAAGATLINDVAALAFEPELAGVAAAAAAPICLMHAQGDPATMQDNPVYQDVLLDVFDFLSGRIAVAEAAGIARSRIMIDPGIGFGKTTEHNLTLLRGLSLFHGLGCPIVLGASRKRFIGTIAGVASAEDRAPGSVAVALGAVLQGVQVLRVHDIKETRQALSLWQAVRMTREEGQI